jgi:iron-sulfur cluster assembly protein
VSLSVAPEAAAQLRAVMPAERAAAGDGLRIAVRGGGCAGVTYHMDFDAPHARDKVIDADGLKILVDPKSYFYINGSRLLYREQLTGSGFSLENPNVKGTCGCGVSFQV